MNLRAEISSLMPRMKQDNTFLLGDGHILLDHGRKLIKRIALISHTKSKDGNIA
jgi:hypothetical protein